MTPPAPATPSGNGSDGSPNVEAPAASAPPANEGSGGAPDADPPAEAERPSPAAAVQVSACRQDRMVGCEVVYIRVVKSDPDLCVQLVLDNCDAARVGLRVRTPFQWTLSSGSASTGKACTLAEYDPKSEPALEGSGSISWLEEGPVISDVQFAVQLELSPAPESTLPALIDVATVEALGNVAACE